MKAESNNIISYVLEIVEMHKFKHTHFLSCVSTFSKLHIHTCERDVLLLIPTKLQKLELINRKLCDEKNFKNECENSQAGTFRCKGIQQHSETQSTRSFLIESHMVQYIYQDDIISSLYFLSSSTWNTETWKVNQSSVVLQHLFYSLFLGVTTVVDCIFVKFSAMRLTFGVKWWNVRLLVVDISAWSKLHVALYL